MNGLETELAARIDARRVLVVVGSGISLATTENEPAASWKGLIANGIDYSAAFEIRHADENWRELQHQLLSNNTIDDLLLAAESVSRCLGWKPNDPCDGNWTDWLSQSVGLLEPQKPEFIQAITDLDTPILTLNYDNLLAEVTKRRVLTWQESYLWPRYLEQGGRGAILHLHGHWHWPSSVILGIRSYDHVQAHEFAQHMQRAFASLNSLLFIGCAGTLEDPNFSALVDWMGRNLQPTLHRHYLLLPKGETLPLSQDQLRAARIAPLYYQNLLSFIRSLAPKRRSSDPFASFAEEVAKRKLTPCLQDIGLAELTVAWLEQEAGVPKPAGRIAVKAIALLASKSGRPVADALLVLLGRSQIRHAIVEKLDALLSYMDRELREEHEVKQVSSGQRSIRVSKEIANSIVLDLHSSANLLRRLKILPEAEEDTSLNPQPTLDANVFEEDAAGPEGEEAGLRRFFYGAQRTPFLGRKKELEALEGFLTDGEAFRWWLVTGQGGLGKSRLALELCLRNGNVWRAGFLPHPPVLSLAQYENWVPNQPTLIIADYAGSRPKVIGSIISLLKNRADNHKLPHPVRLLLLERETPKYYERKSFFVRTTEEYWFRILADAGQANKMNVMDNWYRSKKYMRLESLDSDALWAIICTFAKERIRDERRGELLNELKRIDDLCRPLYASMLGDAIGAGDDLRRQWDQEAILDYILDREKTKFWPAAGVTEEDKDLLALATIVEGIETEADCFPDRLKPLIRAEPFSLERYGMMAAGSTNTLLKALEPDIIGEVYVLDHLASENLRRDMIIELAWSLAPERLEAFLLRAVDDFPHHPTLPYFLRKLVQVEGDSFRFEPPLRTERIYRTLCERGHLELAKEMHHAA